MNIDNVYLLQYDTPMISLTSSMARNKVKDKPSGLLQANYFNRSFRACLNYLVTLCGQTYSAGGQELMQYKHSFKHYYSNNLY